MRVCFSAVSGRAGFQTGNLRGHFPILRPAKLTERDDMIRRQKHGWLVVVLAGAALAACVQGEQQSQSADSTARNLTLAPTESTAALKDVPAPATEAAKPAAEKKAPVKKPVAAKPAPLMLAAGTREHQGCRFRRHRLLHGRLLLRRWLRGLGRRGRHVLQGGR